MSSWTLEANDQGTLLVRAQVLPQVMEGIQKCFGFFILIDVTLMLMYWLLHTYHAYFTFQVRLDEKVCLYHPFSLSGRPSPCCSIFSHHSGRVLESVFALRHKRKEFDFLAERLTLSNILFSYFLVFRFTGDAGAVIRRLEETKTGSKDEHDKQVMKNS